MAVSNEDVIVVSGLPRSGTSLMMRVLDRAGVPVLTDGVRQPDRDNPNGYYEFERVKQLEHDSGWLGVAKGKAVKIIYRHLPYLPRDLRYHIVFMRRDVEEVLRSQELMVERLTQTPATPAERQQLRRAFERQLAAVLAEVARRSEMSLLEVNYNELVGAPEESLRVVHEFLGLACGLEQMAECVDPGLYRNRVGGPSAGGRPWQVG